MCGGAWVRGVLGEGGGQETEYSVDLTVNTYEGTHTNTDTFLRTYTLACINLFVYTSDVLT